MIKIKRAYEAAGKTDGYRVLIDRLWPRGVSKAHLQLDEWAKELAPSTELRKSFAHDPARWNDFRTKYLKELQSRTARDRIADLLRLAKRTRVTIVYGARDEEHNNAVVLKELLDRKLGAEPRSHAEKAA